MAYYYNENRRSNYGIHKEIENINKDVICNVGETKYYPQNDGLKDSCGDMLVINSLKKIMLSNEESLDDVIGGDLESFKVKDVGQQIGGFIWTNENIYFMIYHDLGSDFVAIPRNPCDLNYRV